MVQYNKIAGHLRVNKVKNVVKFSNELVHFCKFLIWLLCLTECKGAPYFKVFFHVPN